MFSNNKSVGRIGEQYAAHYLEEQGFIIREINATSRWGEIDIVAEKDFKIYFVEVKTRINTRQGNPYEAVHGLKLRHLARTIQHYILIHHLEKRKHQLDVISIELHTDMTVYKLKRYENVKVEL